MNVVTTFTRPVSQPISLPRNSKCSLRIIFITRNYPPAICGVGDHTSRMIAELDQLGHESIVFTATPATTGNERGNLFTTNNFDKSIFKPLLQLAKSTSQRTYLLWQYVPYSYQGKGLPFWWPWVMFKLWINGVKQAVYFHEVSVRLIGYGWRQSLVAIGQRLVANLANLLAEVTFTSIRFYQSYFLWKKPALVPVGANITPLDRDILVKQHQVFCFTNRADEALLIAFDRLRQSFPVRLMLAGSASGSQNEKLQAMLRKYNLQDMVFIKGQLPAIELSEIIAESAIFFQPQIVERNSHGGISAKNGTIMAAMSMGKAIITCAADMTDREIFRERVNMQLVPYGNADAYHDAMLYLLSHVGFAQKLGSEARKTYLEVAAWQKSAGTIAQLLSESPN